MNTKTIVPITLIYLSLICLGITTIISSYSLSTHSDRIAELEIKQLELQMNKVDGESLYEVNEDRSISIYDKLEISVIETLNTEEECQTVNFNTIEHMHVDCNLYQLHIETSFQSTSDVLNIYGSSHEDAAYRLDRQILYGFEVIKSERL